MLAASRAGLVLLLLALAVPPWRGARAASAQIDTGRADVRIALIGDFGVDSLAEKQVSALVHGLLPDLVATLGDNNYPGGSQATIDEHVGRYYHDFIAPYRGRFGPGASENRFFPALGNHDWKTPNAAPYLDYFSLPGNGRYYSVRAGAVELFILDSDRREPDGIDAASIQAQWLRAALAASTAPFRVVVFHHPAYSSGQRRSHAVMQWPFREWGASAVFSGHDHDYERLDVAGLPYVVAGTAGAQLFPFGARVAGSEVRLERYGALLVEADPNQAQVSFVTSDGEVADRFALPPAGTLPAGAALVASGSSWQYQSGAAPAPGWTAPSFDASAWPAGLAPLGNGDREVVTPIPPGPAYFRRDFAVAAPAALGWLQLGLLKTDDPEIASLNGAEIARLGFARRHHSGATSRESGSGPAGAAVAHVLVDPARLGAGANVLAVELQPEKAAPLEFVFDAALVGFPAPLPLIARTAAWSYWDDGSAPDPAWLEPSFDASAWPSGAAPLAYGDPSAATQLRAPAQRNAPGFATSYFRSAFSVADASLVSELLLRAPRDDGAVVYLNGVEVTRWNLPLGAPAPAASATPTAHDADGAALVEVPIAGSALVSGANTVAVELHPAGANAPLTLELELVAVLR